MYYQKGTYRIKVKNSDVSKFARWNGWARNESLGSVVIGIRNISISPHSSALQLEGPVS